LLVVVVAGLAAATYGGWRMQRSMDDRLAQLTEQLDALNRTQRELLKREEPAPVLEITGRAYLGDPAKPAAGATLKVCRLSDKAEILAIRALRADAGGAFRSGALPPGDYYVLANLLHETDVMPDRTYYIQSQPQYLYPGVKLSPLELDVELHHGRLMLEASESVPLITAKAGSEASDPSADGRGRRAAVRLHLQLQAQRLHWIPWTPTRTEPDRWPIIGVQRSTSMDWGASPEDYREERVLAAGTYRLEAHIRPEEIDQYLSRSKREMSEAELKAWVLATTSRGVERLRSEDYRGQEIEIREGQTTRVRLEIPVDYAARVQTMLDTDPFWWWSAEAHPKGKANQDAQAVPLKLTVLEPQAD
jgi:hypothetical protein